MVASSFEEDNLYKNGYKCIVGVDESGMGSFAGDVYVAAVIFPRNIDYKKLMPGLNDSKKKTEKQREMLYNQITQCASSYAIATASVSEIDELNIYWARFLAARRALSMLSLSPDFVLVDGNKVIPEIDTDQKAIVKGDCKSISIAAASILAKVERDKHILGLAKLVHRDYEWELNKSYYSKNQVDAIKKHGKTLWHRKKYVAKYLE